MTCLSIILNTFIACGEGGNFCSFDCMWLSRVYSNIAEGLEDDAIDSIFGHIDRLFLAGDFADVDALLSKVDLSRLTHVAMVAFLSITLVAKERLPERKTFFAKVEAHLRETAPERIKPLLDGLE